MAYGNRAYSEATYSGLGLNPNATVGVTGVSATGSVRNVAVAGESEHPVTSEPIAITLGTVSAEASLDYLTTIYAHYPIGNYYAGLGYHFTKVETDEKLHTSSYGSEDLQGIQLSLGMNSGNLRYEVSYSDFADIELTSSNGDKITADADNMMFKLSYVYGQ